MSTVLTFEVLGDEELAKLVEKEKATEKDGKRLFCAACRRVITNDTLRIPVDGTVEHTFTNPHGIEFHLACFSAAEGCGQIGVPTEEWTWFPGYFWRLAVCVDCGTHLGWSYQSDAGDAFYGLILDRLLSAS